MSFIKSIVSFKLNTHVQFKFVSEIYNVCSIRYLPLIIETVSVIYQGRTQTFFLNTIRLCQNDHRIRVIAYVETSTNMSRISEFKTKINLLFKMDPANTRAHSRSDRGLEREVEQLRTSNPSTSIQRRNTRLSNLAANSRLG